MRVLSATVLVVIVAACLALAAQPPAQTQRLHMHMLQQLRKLGASETEVVSKLRAMQIDAISKHGALTRRMKHLSANRAADAADRKLLLSECSEVLDEEGNAKPYLDLVPSACSTCGYFEATGVTLPVLTCPTTIETQNLTAGSCCNDDSNCEEGLVCDLMNAVCTSPCKFDFDCEDAAWGKKPSCADTGFDDDFSSSDSSPSDSSSDSSPSDSSSSDSSTSDDMSDGCSYCSYAYECSNFASFCTICTDYIGPVDEELITAAGCIQIDDDYNDDKTSSSSTGSSGYVDGSSSDSSSSLDSSSSSQDSSSSSQDSSSSSVDSSDDSSLGSDFDFGPIDFDFGSDFDFGGSDSVTSSDFDFEGIEAVCDKDCYNACLVEFAETTDTLFGCLDWECGVGQSEMVEAISRFCYALDGELCFSLYAEFNFLTDDCTDLGCCWYSLFGGAAAIFCPEAEMELCPNSLIDDPAGSTGSDTGSEGSTGSDGSTGGDDDDELNESGAARAAVGSAVGAAAVAGVLFTL